MNKAAFKYLYKIHTYLGLFVAAHFFIFAVTGVPLLFKDEILAESNEPSKSEASIDTSEHIGARYDRIVSDLKSIYPQDRLLALFPDDEHLTQINVRLGIDGSDRLRGARKLVYDLQTAKPLLSPEKSSAGFFDWMLLLHRELFLGSNGKIYVGLIGLLYVFILISGFFIYGNFMKNRSLGSIRSMRIPKLVDLHKYVGVMTFGWSLVVGLSGAVLGFNGVLIKFFQYRSFNHLAAQYQTTSTVTVPNSQSIATAPLEKIIESALSQKTDWTVSYISYPYTEFGIPDHFLLLINGTTAITERISELAVVHATTADLVEVIELPFYLKLAMLSEPLHFGDYGGLPLKVLWALFTVCSLAVVIFGVMSFILKRRNRYQTIASVASMEHKHNKIKNCLKGTVFFRQTYTLPLMLSLATLASAVVLLFDDSVLSYLAFVFLVIPLLFIFLLRSRH